MKSALVIIIAAAFLGIAVFGFSALGHEITRGICLAILWGGAKLPCPAQDPLGFANLHINIFKNFSLAKLADSAMAAALLGFLFMPVSAMAGQSFLASPKFAPLHSLNQRLTPAIAHRRQILRWLSLHENSPANF